MHRVLGFAAALAFVASESGCGMVSDSARSASKSVSSPLRSSGSSSPQQDAAYMREIRDFTFGYARSGGDPQAFSRGVGSLAQRHGVSDWHRDQDTCMAIGQGMRAAGLDGANARKFAEGIAPAGSQAAAWIREGYHTR